jgi:hypothetical protein
MAGATHQTVRLAAGRHRTPDDGACVMELASMLAGEPFSDRPRCADPVLAGYLRAFNDRLSPSQRRRLHPYAAAVVGTSGDRRATRARRRACLRYAGGRPLVALRLGLRAALSRNGGPGAAAAREVVARGDDGFAFLDALLGNRIAAGGVPAPCAEPALSLAS